MPSALFTNIRQGCQYFRGENTPAYFGRASVTTGKGFIRFPPAFRSIFVRAGVLLNYLILHWCYVILSTWHYIYYHVMIIVYFTVGSTSSGSAFFIAPKLGAKTNFELISLWRWLLPLYFLIRFLDQISHTFVLFKDVTLTWINYLETWLRSDNTSYYYTISLSSP